MRILTVFALISFCSVPLFAETDADCTKSGGILKAPAKGDRERCACPDGRWIDASRERCLEKARTAAEMKDVCDGLAFEPGDPLTVGALSAFAKKRRATTAAQLFDSMRADKDWEGFFADARFQNHSESAEKNGVDPENPRRIQYHRGIIIGSTSHPKTPALNNFVQLFQADPKTVARTEVANVRRGSARFR